MLTVSPSAAWSGGGRTDGGAPRRTGGTTITRAVFVVLSALTLLLAGADVGTAAASSPAPERDVEVRVLSPRADLVSGGDVLVEVVAPGARTRPSVDVDGRDVSRAFSQLSSGTWRGLVTGLRLGRNQVRAVLPDGRGAGIAVTNHSSGGPLLAGPQIQPWTCAQVASFGRPRDRQCSTEPQYTFVYKNAASGQFAPYDPQSPPAAGLVATTTTDQGVTVPYIVREERGSQDRGYYFIRVLYDPSEPFTATQPQRGWNGKFLIPFGPGSGATHGNADPGDGSYSPAALQDNELALSRGFLIARNSLNVHGQNLNDVVNAEAVLMLKERVIEQYGPIRYTLSNGCSGGGIAQYMISAMYPGLLDGIQPTCSFEDFWTTITETADCGLTVRYFEQASPQLWPEASQQSAVDGHAPLGCKVWDVGFGRLLDPANPDSCGVPAESVYQPTSNPRGVRCSAQDYMRSVWGPRPRAAWGPVERHLGVGFPEKPIDNVGVQYGLEAFQQGRISAAQFVDLNAHIGGFDIDHQLVPQRMTVDPGTLRTAYRGGQITDARQLATVAILDLRGYSEVGEVHTSFHSYALRARLDQRNGHHRNQVIWTASPVTPILPVPLKAVTDQALLALDSWLTAVEADRSGRTRAQKVADLRPADVTDACFVGASRISSSPTCDGATPPFDSHRGVAGGPLTNDVVKCQLKPLRVADYSQPLTSDQVATLRRVFPQGVCDYSRPSQGWEPARPWQTFMTGPGGTDLGPAPVSRPLAGSGGRAAGASGVTAVRAAQALPTTGGTPPVLALAVLVVAGLLARATRAARGPQC